LLGLTLPASAGRVDAAFKRAALRNHPDRGGSDEMMAKLNRARAVLRGAA
jgi:curved DNA-binding protein CbpA